MNELLSSAQKRISFTLCMLVMFFLSVQTVHADMGAKPSIDVTIENAPEGYYVALLRGSDKDQGDNSELFLKDVTEESVYSYLDNLSYKGWFYHESPVGTNCFHSNESDRYGFGYMVPDPFRVIVISDDGHVYISDELDQKEFNATCVYDLKAGTLKELRVGIIAKRVLAVVLCFLFTLLIEFGVFLLFRFARTKENILCFLITNAVTNIPFNIFIVNSISGLVLLFYGFFFELLITIVESLVYANILKDAEGRQHKVKGFIYGVVANMSSILIGIFLLEFFTFLIGFTIAL